MAELVRRRVLRTAGLYLVAVWGVSQGAAELFPLFGASDGDVRLFIIAALALLPLVVVLAWNYDLTARGPIRDTTSFGDERGAAERVDETTLSVSMADIHGQYVRVELRDGRGDAVSVQASEFVIGRGDDCAVKFEDRAVSRSHARVFHRDGSWRIRDLGSTNGTWVDGDRVEETVLPESCRVRVNERGPTLHLSLLPAADASSAGLDLGRVLVAGRA